MNCLQCQAPVDLAAKHCGACGAAIDADGDGVPDVLAKMIEDKARALLVSERAREASEAEAKAAQERDEARRAQIAEDRAALARAHELLEKNTNKRRRVFYVDKTVATIVAIGALVLGACIFPGCVEPIARRSVVSATLICPSKCSGCRGPGHVFTWHESGGSYEGNVSNQICPTRAPIEADAVTAALS